MSRFPWAKIDLEFHAAGRPDRVEAVVGTRAEGHIVVELVKGAASDGWELMPEARYGPPPRGRTENVSHTPFFWTSNGPAPRGP